MMERKRSSKSNDCSSSQSHKLKKPESHQKYANKDVIPQCELWTDGLICAFEFIRGHKRTMNSKAGSMIPSDGKYSKKKVPADGLSEASLGLERSRLPDSLSFKELRSDWDFSVEDGRNGHVLQSGLEGGHWVPIGWARISFHVQTVQVDGELVLHQLELMDDEDDIVVADLAAP